MKKNKFLYPYCPPRICEIVNIFGSMYPEIYINEEKHISNNLPKRPDTLYHYCNEQGFKGIIESNSLWLSTLRQTNDELEIIYFYNLFKHYIASQQYTPQERYKITLLDKNFKCNLQNAFSTSFTTLKDISWQWNEYGDKNKGFVIGFSADKLTSEYNLPERNFFIKLPSLLKVDYNEKSHKKILKTTISKYLTNERDTAALALYYAKISCLCKTLKWSKEKEWRLLYFPFAHNEIEDSLYNSLSKIVKIDDNKYAYKIPINAITEIIIGSKNISTIEQVKHFLKIHFKGDVSKIKVHCSRNHFKL